MRITFHGAAHTVTGSQYLIEVNGKRILLECGLFQGPRRETYERNRKLPFDAASIDTLILSHAHIDHSGNIPNLVKSGFRNDVVCTFATRDLCAAMLRDSGHIHEKDAEFVNKHRARKGEPPIEPLYTERDAIATLGQFLAIGYERPYQVAPGVTVTFYDAGHMLGSAIVALDVEDDESKRRTRLVFSGDLGRPNAAIIRDPTLLTEADALILESTYGGRTHDSYPDATKELERIVNETYDRGGKVIIPAFAVGRTQQIVYALNKLYHDGNKFPDMRVFVDSPLAVDATGIFRLHPDAYREEARTALLEDPDGDIFGFHRLNYVRHVEDSKEINSLREPCIIISASGMAEAGRILHHLKNNVENSHNTVLIVGWQAPHTLGRRLVEKQPVVRIFGEEYRLRARVEIIDGFSSHADHDELLTWASAFERKPKHTFLVHGEDESLHALQNALHHDLGFENIAIADLHQTVEI